MCVRTETPQELRDIFKSARQYRAEVSGDFALRKQRLLSLIGGQISDETTALDEQHQLKRAQNDAKKSPLLDKDYVQFVGELEAVNDPMSSDFRRIESLIGHLDRTNDELLKTKQIAPFNSNLPVLKISQCSPETPSRLKPMASIASSGKTVVATPKKTRATKTTNRSKSSKKANKRTRAGKIPSKLSYETKPSPVQPDTYADCAIAPQLEQEINQLLESSDDSVDANSGQTPANCEVHIFENNVQTYRQQVLENERRLEIAFRQQRERTASIWQHQLQGVIAAKRQLFAGAGAVESVPPSSVDDELELQALQQYSNSSESLDTQFSRLEREAQSQYSNVS